MRKQMQLNKETDEILKHYKREYEEENGNKASYGFIVNIIVHELHSDFSKIDWELVRDTKSNKAPKTDKTSKEYITTLNLTNKTEENISTLQKIIIKDFGVARVYMAFAVKMILRAYYLKDKQKININKE